MAASCLHITLIPLSVIALIFVIVALASNHWVTISSCWNPKDSSQLQTVKYSSGLFNKCSNDKCTNIMDSPPEMKALSPDCGSKNSWYVKDQWCQSYFKCVNGVKEKEGTCAAGQQFNLFKLQCEDYDEKAMCDCHDLRCKAPDAAGLTGKNYRADVLCTSFFQCKKEGANSLYKYTFASCGSSLFFDDGAANKCVSPASKPASCMDSVCVANNAGLTKVVVTSSPATKCEKYYTCQNGKRVPATGESTCTAGVQTLRMAYPWGTCLASAQPLDQIATCQDPVCKAMTIASTSLPKSKLVYAAAANCQDYYTCSTSEMITYATCTGTNIYFDSAAEKCTSTKPTACTDYRCFGRGDGYKKVDSTCTAWTRCNNGGKDYTTGNCAGSTKINEAGGNPNTAPCTSTQNAGCKHPDCVGRSAGYVVVSTPACQKYWLCAGDESLTHGNFTCGGAATSVFVLSEAATSPQCKTTTKSGSTTCWDPICSAKDATHTKTEFWYKNGVDGVSNQRDCQKYYKCTKGFIEEKDCGSSSFFTTTNNACTSSRPSTCQDKRCHRYADGKHVTDGKACINYKVCATHVQTNTGSCGSTSGGTQMLFDTVQQKCVDPGTSVPTGCEVRVDGGWSPWDLDSACLVNRTYDADAEVGVTFRMRFCTCPKPSPTGSNCDGKTFEMESSLCYICSPEKSWLTGARCGMGLAMACSILTLAWAIWVNVSKKTYAANLTIFHALVSVLAGLIGAIMYNSNKPDIPFVCTVETGWGFIMALLAAIVQIFTLIIAIVVAVKSRNRVQSADMGTKMTKREEQEPADA